MQQWMTVKVHPNAGKDMLVSIGPGRFEAWVAAKPIGGRANEAVAKLLGRYLEIPRGRLRLVRGGQGRHKIFRIG